MARRLKLESAVVVGLVSSTLYTILVAPGLPESRPWFLPLAVLGMLSSIGGLISRRLGHGRLAGVGYCAAALTPNAIYVVNALVLAIGVAALLGINSEELGSSSRTHE